MATPTLHPFPLLNSCEPCLEELRSLFRDGTGGTTLTSGRALTLREENADMSACKVCGFEAITHGMDVDDRNLLRMCSRCREVIHQAIS